MPSPVGGGTRPPVIPRSRPSPLFEVAVPAGWSHWYQRFIVAGGVAWVGGGWDRAPGPDGPVLVGVDATSGAEVCRLQVPVAGPGHGECQVATPASVEDQVLVAVYEHGRNPSLRAYLLDLHGRVWRVDDLARGREAALDVDNADPHIKLWLDQPVVRRDVYLVSWAYRSRRYHAQCRDTVTGALRWETDERVLLVAGDVALMDTGPVWEGSGVDRRLAGAPLVGRRLSDGAVCWRLPGIAPLPVSSRSPVGVAGDAFVVVDRSGRGKYLAERENGVLELAMAAGDPGEVDWDALASTWDEAHPPPPGEDLVGYGASDGRERWRLALDGWVVSAMCGPRDICAVVAGGPGRHHLLRVAGDGTPTAGTGLGTDRLAATGPDSAGTPVIAAVDDTHVVVATATGLICTRLDDPGQVVWEVPSPVDARRERDHPQDRDLREAAVTATDGRLYVRDRETLLAFAPADGW